jgi:hypothetical protein
MQELARHLPSLPDIPATQLAAINANPHQELAQVRTVKVITTTPPENAGVDVRNECLKIPEKQLRMASLWGEEF